jgi:YfiR/HmsC-like
LSKPGVSARGWIACATLFVLTGAFGTARAQQFSGDAVKAAFLYRFASYIEWPPDAPPGPLVIAVAGADDVASQLDALLPRVTVRGIAPEVRRISRTAELEGVHILYVGPKSLSRTRALRAAALDRPILIVTDDEGGLDGGAVVNFFEAGRNVRFEISLIASDRARLKIDAALLSVAARVERRPQAWTPCEPRCRIHLAMSQTRSFR